MLRAEERPVAVVLADMACNIQEIVRSEVRLAKAQIKHEAGRAARPVTRILSGIILVLYAFSLLLLAAVYFLSQFVPPWVAALIMCLIVVAVAAPLLTSGMRRWSLLRPAQESHRS